ncbi:MAG: ABC transporter ATP-binding protein [Oscillospiraceae bacterium]
MDKNIIEIKYKEGFYVDIVLSANNLKFDDIIDYPSIKIMRNKTTFIWGESGCGKTTLLKLFNATLSPSTGEISYNNRNTFDMDTVQLRKEITLVSQTVFLFDKTIEENFNEFYKYRDVKPLSKEDMKKYLCICCADFDLSAQCERMSGGERQRVFIAICLSFLPKVLMLDEPTSALDSETANRFFENTKLFCSKNEITLIVISHDKTLADKFADEKILLEKRGI